MNKIVLASGSAIRARILQSAGVDFKVLRPDVDEDEIKRASQTKKLGLEETAMVLAEAKALAVSADPAALVVGSDQILEFRGAPFDKPATMAAARERLMQLQGQTHSLINAVAVARDNTVIWRHIDRPILVMRAMSEREIDDYLVAAGEQILASVGAYQVEQLGARLFEKIDGDYFAVLGLSLFPLLGFLRTENAVAF